MKLLEFMHVTKKCRCFFFESHISLDPISHDCMAQNSALVLLWLLAHPFCFVGGFSQALNLTLSWEGEQLVSKVPLASAPPSSRSKCAAWHGSATTEVASSWGPLQMPPLHPSFSPSTFCWILENGELSFSDTTEIRNGHWLTPEMTWLNWGVLLSRWSPTGVLHSGCTRAVLDFLDHFNRRTEGLRRFK